MGAYVVVILNALASTARTYINSGVETRNPKYNKLLVTATELINYQFKSNIFNNKFLLFHFTAI